MRRGLCLFVKIVVMVMSIAYLAACSVGDGEEWACSDRTLNVGFYAYFEPVSFSADPEQGSSEFNTHRGYESDLLTALEAMNDAGLKFSRKAVPDWEDIWLLSATPEFDLIGGGITALDSRTMDSSGSKVVTFTTGHIAFRQSLLVRVEDAERLSSHDKLTSDVVIGALRGTTGEARLLQLTGLVNNGGTLAAGVRFDTPRGPVTTDGSASYFITAAGDSGNLENRQRLYPPSDDTPQVIYLGDDMGEAELLDALADGRIDAVARGEIGNLDASAVSNGQFVVTALDAATEHGGFTVDAKDADLAGCLNERIDWLTDNRNIGYREWLQDPTVFMQRAGCGTSRPDPAAWETWGVWIPAVWQSVALTDGGKRE